MRLAYSYLIYGFCLSALETDRAVAHIHVKPLNMRERDIENE
jgi:hypothetical protein